jgi:hypothetical protein
MLQKRRLDFLSPSRGKKRSSPEAASSGEPFTFIFFKGGFYEKAQKFFPSDDYRIPPECVQKRMIL